MVKSFDAGLYGAFAMNAMRLEKGYRAWGAEYTTERTPLEAGAGLFVKTRNREFIGKQSMLERQSKDSRWTMCLLELEESGEDPFYAHTVLQNGLPIGIVTSGSYGHRIGAPLVLAYFSKAPDNGELTVEILGKPVAAKILDDVPYDPQSKRLP